jgi:hypothetical protein
MTINEPPGTWRNLQLREGAPSVSGFGWQQAGSFRRTVFVP